MLRGRRRRRKWSNRTIHTNNYRCKVDYLFKCIRQQATNLIMINALHNRKAISKVGTKGLQVYVLEKLVMANVYLLTQLHLTALLQQLRVILLILYYRFTIIIIIVIVIFIILICIITYKISFFILMKNVLFNTIITITAKQIGQWGVSLDIHIRFIIIIIIVIHKWFTDLVILINVNLIREHVAIYSLHSIVFTLRFILCL